MNIILASASPRRQQLLRQLGLRFTVQAAELDEDQIEAIDPGSLVEALSQAKAALVAEAAAEDALIIAADTVVVLDGRVLGKPADAAEAAAMLTALSGRSHEVYTGLTLLETETGHRAVTHEITSVRFRELAPAEIAAYVATGEPLDKAGAYGIQEYGATLVCAIAGDYFNVVGLPLYRLSLMLKDFDLDLLTLAAAREEVSHEEGNKKKRPGGSRD